MKKVTFGIAALSLTIAGAALAQTPGTPGNAGATGTTPATTPGSKAVVGQFGTMDTNRDGKVSRDEAKSHTELTSSFAGLDTDSDTYLSEKEFGMWKSSGAKDSGKTEMPGRSTNGGNSGSTDRSNSGSTDRSNTDSSTDRGTTPMPTTPGTR